jgi:hypothetical protein
MAYAREGLAMAMSPMVVSLAPVVEAVPVARQLVQYACGVWSLPDTQQVPLLHVVDEIVSAAVAYARAPVELRLLPQKDCVRVEVFEAALPEIEPPQARIDNARRQRILDAYTRRWGVTASADSGDVTWAEVAAPGSVRAARAPAVSAM